MVIQISWLKDCEICNAGLCKTVNELKDQGLTENAACKQMSNESEGLYSTEAIRGRYLWHTGKVKRKVVDSQQSREKRETNKSLKEKLERTERKLENTKKELEDADLYISKKAWNRPSEPLKAFKSAYNAFYGEILVAKEAKWDHVSKEDALKCAESLVCIVQGQ